MRNISIQVLANGFLVQKDGSDFNVTAPFGSSYVAQTKTELLRLLETLLAETEED